MNKLLLGGLLCLFAFNVTLARHHGERIESETSETLDDDSQTDFRKVREHNNPPRHRKRRWQNYGYEYQPPHQYFADRRDYNNNHELIPQIYRILDDISSYIKRQSQVPPPPPQPIYVPYPIPYYVPKYVPVTCKTAGSKVNITGRFPALEDINQNWGFVTNDLPDVSYDDSDDTRPISFEPIKPKQPNLKRPAPPVEHGSTQANSQVTTQAPVINSPQASSSKAIPSLCNAAILSCCSISNELQRRTCFLNIGCNTANPRATMCTANSINDALEAIKNAYAPM